ncbi:MAG: SPOR domain-containing protein [Gammaproteobacteria bacterium]|nr:SPOR domain-containing protein [Gammaproteobacteria bacterium]
MRNLFFALLLANLAFAAWQAWLAPAPDPGLDAAGSPSAGLREETAAGRRGSERAGTERPPDEDPAARDGGTPAGVDGDARTGAGAASGNSGDGAAADRPVDPAAVPGSESSRAGPAPDAAAAAPVRPVAATGTGAAAAGAAPSGTRCVSVGPFAELSQAATASAKLRAAGYEATQRVGQGEIWVGYWVHIDGIPTREEADAALATLHRNGLAEAYRIPGEQDGDMISLGVFTEVSRAGRLRDQVRQLGLEPVIVDRTRRGTVYWVDVRVAAAEDLDFETLQGPGVPARLEQRACGSAGI